MRPIHWLWLLALAPSAAASYEGPLYDSHVHIGLDGLPAAYHEPSTRNGVAHSIVFAMGDIDSPEDSWLDLREEFGGRSTSVVLFFGPEDDPQNLDPERLAPHFDLVPFRGTGEWPMYRPDWLSLRYDAPLWQRHFEFAEERDVWVMTHPRFDQVEDLADALERNPGVKILVHGLPPYETTLDLLRGHANMAYTMDARSAFMCDWSQMGPPECFWPGTPGWEGFEARRADLLEHAVQTWAPVVAAAPDRVLWGTDVGTPAAVEDAVYDAILAFSREFIARLPVEQQAGYAHDNAFRLFGAGSPVPEAPAEGLPSPSILASLVLLGLAAVLLRRRP